MKRSSFLDNKFRVVFGFRVVFNDEASNTRLLKTFHQDFWIWLLNLSPWRKALTRTVFWWEQVISKLPSQEKLGVASRQNQPISPSLMALDVFGAQMLLVGVMILSIRDSWCSYHQDLKSNCSSFQFPFLIFGVSRNSSLKWCYGSLLFNFLGTSLFCIKEVVLLLGHQVFVFLEDFLWGAIANDEACNIRLLKTFHYGFWIWLLNLWHIRKSLRELSIDGNKSTKPSLSRIFGRCLASEPTNHNLLWWLSIFLVLGCCCF